MSDNTFGVLFALCSVVITAVLLLISRFNQRLTDPSSNNQQWIWSSQLNRAGRCLLVVGVFLMLTGFVCLVFATPLVGGALLWRLHLRYGLRQLAMNIKQRLPDAPTKQTLFSVVRIAGQLCSLARPQAHLGKLACAARNTAACSAGTGWLVRF